MRGGQNRKSPDLRQGHRPGIPQLVAVAPSKPSMLVPQPPAGLLKSTQDKWVVFWRSDLAGAIVSTDHLALERYFQTVDECARVARVFRKTRLIVGSQGQPVLSPLGRYLATLSTELLALEDRFGLSPIARSRLGLVAAQAKLTAAELLDDLDQDDATEVTWAEVE